MSQPISSTGQLREAAEAAQHNKDYTSAAESARLAALHAYQVLDTDSEQAFDGLTKLAAQICQTPIALVSLVDADRQWFKSNYGLDVCSTARDLSFCSHAIRQDGPLIVRDARKDPRFANNALVTGEPWIRFYAGVPLVTADGHALGTLCVIDTVARELSSLQREQLNVLAQQVMDQLVLRRQASELALEVTARRNSQSALIANEQRWRSLVEHSPVAVAVIGASGHFKFCNPRGRELYGTEDIVGHHAGEFVPAGDEDATATLFAAVMNGETVLGRRWTLRRIDGTSISTELNAVRVDYCGELSLQVELRDMTEVAAAEQALRRSENRWRQLVDDSPIGIGVSDEVGRIVTANAAFCAIVGRSPSEVVGLSGADFAGSDEVNPQVAIQAMIATAPAGVAQLERRFLRPDGEVRWVELTASHTPGPEGRAWTLSHLQDITSRKRAEHALIESEADLTSVATVVRQIQLGGDARQTIVHAGLKLAKADYVSLLEPSSDGTVLCITATTEERLLGTEVSLVTPTATGEVFRSGKPFFLADPDKHPLISRKHLALTESRSMFTVPVHSADSVAAVLIVSWKHRVPDLSDRRARVVTLLADNAGVGLRQAALLVELQSLALTDPLTKLPNRRNWDERVDTLMRVARRAGEPLTIAIADLDYFKRFNDKNGHLAGDLLLQDFAIASRQALRAGDIVARWGGEEFAFALPNCPSSEAAFVLERVRDSVPHQATCSIGHATWDDTESADALMRRADLALYAAKDAGRNRTLAA